MKLKLLLFKKSKQTKKKLKNKIIIIIFKSFKSPASGKENVWFLDSPDFEKISGLPDRTLCPVEPYIGA